VHGLPTIFIGTIGLGGADHEPAELADLIARSI